MPAEKSPAYVTPELRKELDRIFDEFFLICELRLEEEGMSLAEWSRRSGVSRAGVSRYRRGHKFYPRLAQVVMLAKVLGLKVSLVLEKDPEIST